MSFDPYVLSTEVPTDDPDELIELLEDPEGLGGELVPELREVADGLKAEWPTLEEDPDNSPWSTHPLEQPEYGREVLALKTLAKSGQAGAAEEASDNVHRGARSSIEPSSEASDALPGPGSRVDAVATARRERRTRRCRGGWLAPGAAHTSLPLSWSTTTVRYRWPLR